MLKAIKKFFLRLYRKYYDYPKNWEGHGWKKDTMTEAYWKGE